MNIKDESIPQSSRLSKMEAPFLHKRMPHTFESTFVDDVAGDYDITSLVMSCADYSFSRPLARIRSKPVRCLRQNIEQCPGIAHGWHNKSCGPPPGQENKTKDLWEPPYSSKAEMLMNRRTSAAHAAWDERGPGPRSKSELLGAYHRSLAYNP
jgi:hypothetical protein